MSTASATLAPVAHGPATSITARTTPPRPHPPVRTGRIGVLLLNLGTPSGTGYFAMRRYLREFLSDPRIVDLPRALWLPLLHGVILTTRPVAKGKEYRRIWNTERDESPLLTTTRATADAVRARVSGWSDRLLVDFGMRYGTPSTRSRIEALARAGCDRLLLVPLYPQYSATTVASACDAAFDALKTLRWQPAVRVATPWYDSPAYIEALASRTRAHLATLSHEPEVLVASFHGIPRTHLALGDPYYCHCMKTGRLLQQALALPDERFRITFQSRFGPAEWLQPYTDVTIRELARTGTRRVAVVAPGFVADCLETIEELGEAAHHDFLAHGGEHFTLVPCLNESAPAVDVLETVLAQELTGWL
ncbi:MAG: ferrochelatase [Gemmatimonadaceae bacterium]|nr:ferrochelatase [Gemmatimonadaceae bacterium]